MPPRKIPYRLRYKSELDYPAKGAVLLPSHGGGPRCNVIYDPNDDGPWTTLQIMRIDDDDEVENYGCVMPRYYAIPLILINKQLSFYEAQCRPDGTPLPRSSSCGIKQRDLREYSYLWRLRIRFLQAIFEMNHERVLDQRWQYAGIHGYLHRMYRRFGHDTYQRIAYWREENKEGRVPYSAPDIAEMDWTAYLLEDMTTSTRINAFLWNRVSQGYSRVVKDKPPFESWRAWRAGHRDHKPVPYLTTPVSSPAREIPSELDDGVSAAAAAVAVAVAVQAMTATQGSSSHCGVGGGSGAYVDTTGVRTAVVTAAPPMQAVAAESARTAGPSRGVGFGAVAEVAASGNGDGDEDAEELEYEDVKVLTADLTGSPSSRRWGLPCPSSSSSSSSSSQQSQLSLEGGSARSMTTMSTSTGTGSQGRLRENQISVKYNAPEDLALAVIHCTFTKRMEDVKNDPRLEVVFAENLS